jgi:uncharacterized coiled-coil DUF342 family protein
MSDTITSQIEEIEAKRKEKLARIKDISDQVRKIAEDIEKIRRESGLGTLDDERMLLKRIEQIDFRISTAKNMPLKMERELAAGIADIEKKLKKVKAAKESSKSLKELETKISSLKDERDKLKKSLDVDQEEIEDLREAMKSTGRRQVREAAIEQFTLGDIAAIKHKKGKSEE